MTGEMDCSRSWHSGQENRSAALHDKECNGQANGKLFLEWTLFLNPGEPEGEGDDSEGKVELRVESLLGQGDNDETHALEPPVE